WPIPQFASQDVVRYSEHAGSVAACSAIGPALDTPGAALRRCGPEHLEHAPPHAAASPGSEVSRGGLPQNRLVELRVSQKTLQTSVLLLQFLQTLRLVRPQTAVLLLPT